jgi:hypothetical protein
MKPISLIKVAYLTVLYSSTCLAGWSERILLDSTISSGLCQIQGRNDSIYIYYDDVSINDNGFLRSLDGGGSWEYLDLFNPEVVWSWRKFGGLEGDTLTTYYDQIYAASLMRLYFSDDFGVTWQGPRQTYAYPLDSELDCTRSGESLYLVIAVLDAGRAAMLSCKSHDFGLNWSLDRYIRHYDTRTIPRIYEFFGRVFIVSSSRHYQDQAPIRILYSDDEGESWVSLDSLTPVAANQRAEMAASLDGKMAFAYHCLVSNYPNDTTFVYICVSSDSGSTWSAPIDLSISTSNAVPRLDVVGDTIAVCWFSGNGFAVRQSYDFGQTWGEPDILDPLATGDLVLDNGKIHAAYVAEYGDFLGLFYRRWVPDVNAIDERLTPKAFSLSQNYPNPFNAQTKIDFSLPQNAHVKINVFDISGRAVATAVDGRFETGNHSVVWDAGGLTSGIYFYQIRAGQHTDTKKLLLIK